jgi:hypothetical protein
MMMQNWKTCFANFLGFGLLAWMSHSCPLKLNNETSGIQIPYVNPVVLPSLGDLLVISASPLPDMVSLFMFFFYYPGEYICNPGENIFFYSEYICYPCECIS